MSVTISEGISYQKVLEKRKTELIKLRDSSATRRFQAPTYSAAPADGTVVEPVYNAIELDKTITRIQREERLLDNAIKRANAATAIEYVVNDLVLGELV